MAIIEKILKGDFFEKFGGTFIKNNFLNSQQPSSSIYLQLNFERVLSMKTQNDGFVGDNRGLKSLLLHLKNDLIFEIYTNLIFYSQKVIFEIEKVVFLILINFIIKSTS